MAITPGFGYTITIYDNSGKNILVDTNVLTTTCTVTETGLMQQSANLYTYTGEGKFLGFSKSKNQSIPQYPVGSSITLGTITTLYVVETLPIKYKVKYKGSELATLNEGNKVTIKCQDKIMLGDVVIERI